MTNAPASWSLTRPGPGDAPTIAAWAASAAEAALWASRAEHPFAAEVVVGWWTAAHVDPYVLRGPDGVPVAYGEVWDDEEEDEVELARLIVDRDRRREGIGRRLVDGLVAVAQRSGRSACYLRVVPENVGARALYAAAGFVEVDEAVAAEWNAGQPVDYVWMQHPAVG